LHVIRQLAKSATTRIRQTGQRLFLPASTRVLNDLGGCLVRLNGLRSDLGLQTGPVILAGSDFARSFSENTVTFNTTRFKSNEAWHLPTPRCQRYGSQGKRNRFLAFDSKAVRQSLQ
jgi:hypothetical protein